jgi:hypothetical protein
MRRRSRKIPVQPVVTMLIQGISAMIASPFIPGAARESAVPHGTQYQDMASAVWQQMRLPSVILSGVGAHATTESKDPGAASCKDVDSGNFCDDRLLLIASARVEPYDRLPFSFRAQRGNLPSESECISPLSS